MKAVLDANIDMSGLITAEGAPGALLDGWQVGRFEALFSNELVEEILEVTGRPNFVRRFRRLQADIDGFRAAVRDAGERSCPPLGDLRDPNDRHVLGAAVGLGADVIVTGDNDLLVLAQFEGIPILTPRQFLALLDGTGPIPP